MAACHYLSMSFDWIGPARDVLSAAEPLRVALGALAAGAVAVAAGAEALTRRELRRRVSVALVPTESFDPSVEEVVRFAAGLGRVRPAVGRWCPREAQAVRVRFGPDEAGRAVMVLEAPARCRQLLASLGYAECEVRPAPLARGGVAGGRAARLVASWRSQSSVRAEMTLARDPTLPLRALALAPDPLTPLVRATEGLDDDEDLVVALDLVPARLRPRAARSGASWDRFLWGPQDRFLWGPQGRRRPRAEPRRETRVAAGAERTEVRRVVDKVAATEPVFAAQVLVATSSPSPARARSHLRAVLGTFEPARGENHWRVRGTHLGLAFAGSDLPGRRGAFDRRLSTGRFRPARAALVTASEIAGWLKPPSRHCPAAGALRSGGMAPPPPPGLPTWKPSAGDLMPLGWVATDGGERAVGVSWDETFFVLKAGRSRFGKTSSAVTAFLAAVRSGSGGLFLDPHRDALEMIKPYLGPVADRVVEVDLSPRGRHALALGWNLLSMDGLGPDDVERRVAAVVDSFSAALHWGEVNTRAINLLTQATQALCELALRLPPELAPTIFQVTTILSNAAWRNEVLEHLGPVSRDFFETRFPRIDKTSEAITPVTNLVDRLRSSNAVAGMLGQSRSGYDIRAAMDQGRIVLACPAGTGDKDRLLACFLVYDLLQAALSRRDLPPERRRPFRAWIDECQTIDGASAGSLAALLEQAGKFGLRLEAMVQQPTRLTATTLAALLNNRSHLISTAVGSESATLLAREWGGKVAPATVGAIDPYHFIASVTHEGAISAPFRLRGMTAAEAFGPPPTDGAAAVDAALARTLARVPVGEVLDHLATLDARILAHLRSGGGPAPRRDRLRVVGQ